MPFTTKRGRGRGRDSLFGITSGYGLYDRGVGVRVPVGQEFSLLRVVQTGYVAHPVSYSVGFAGKAAGA
jgi:hypothetical protein